MLCVYNISIVFYVSEYLSIFLSTNHFVLFQAGSFYGTSGVRGLFPTDPGDSDEESDGHRSDVSDFDDDIRDPDYRQYVEEALAGDAVDEEDLQSPPRKRPRGKYMFIFPALMQGHVWHSCKYCIYFVNIFVYNLFYSNLT